MKTKNKTGALPTGGEWVKVQTENGFSIMEKSIYLKGFSDKIAEVNYCYPNDETEANADLIVSAPATAAKLAIALAALKDIMQISDDMKVDRAKDFIFEKAKQAIVAVE